MDFLDLNSVHWDKLFIPFLLLISCVPSIILYRLDQKNKAYMKRQQDLIKEQKNQKWKGKV